MKAFFTKYISLVLPMLFVLFTINTAKAQPCSAGETEINFVVIGADGGFVNYALLQESTVPGASSYFFNTTSVNECVVDGLCYSVSVIGAATFEVLKK